MAFDSFREYLKRLEAAGELRRITQAVATELEITEIADREMKKPGGGQALFLEKPTVNGQPSPFPPRSFLLPIPCAHFSETRSIIFAPE